MRIAFLDAVAKTIMELDEYERHFKYHKKNFTIFLRKEYKFRQYLILTTWNGQKGHRITFPHDMASRLRDILYRKSDTKQGDKKKWLSSGWYELTWDYILKSYKGAPFSIKRKKHFKFSIIFNFATNCSNKLYREWKLDNYKF